MDTHAELKPCPFCGSSVVAPVGSFVRCGRCGAVGPYGFTELEAAQRWNERADARPAAQIEPIAAIERRDTRKPS